MPNPLTDQNVSDQDYREAREVVEARYFTASENPSVVALRDRIVELGTAIVLLVPGNRQRSVALTDLESVQMRANRGLFEPSSLIEPKTYQRSADA